MAKNNTIKKLAVLAGAGFVANELLKGSTGGRSANVQVNSVNEEAVAALLKNDDAFLTRIKGSAGRNGTGLSELLASSKALPEDLTTLIVGETVRNEDNTETYLVIKKPTAETEDLEDDEFFKLIHGPDYAGPVGPKGATGPSGPKGEDGLNAPAWSNSIIKNLALEDFNLSGWGTGGLLLAETHEALPIVRLTRGATETYLAMNRQSYFDRRILYKISGNIKSDSSNVAIAAFGLNAALQPVAKTNGIYSAFTADIPASSSFTYREMYIGGVGTHQRNLSPDALFIRLSVRIATSGTYVDVNSLKLTPVSLGEPVPANLPWLPTGQMVYDTVTGEVGRYNGTTVNYFEPAA
jgi:hypothetical protein